MGFFSIASKRDTDAAPLESRVSLADADIDRITVAYAKIYFPNGVLVPGTPGVAGQPGQDAIPHQPAVPPTYDADGNMTDPGQPEVQAQDAVPAVAEVPGVPDSYRPPTGQEVFDAVANGLLEGLLANTINVERVEAAKVAQDSVPPIVVTP